MDSIGTDGIEQVDAAAIEALVRTFYKAAECDPKIGPILRSRIQDRERHLGRMRDFFGSLVGLGSFSGPPIAAHFALSLEPADFKCWLEHFESAAHASCRPAGAALLIRRVRGIAAGLEEGTAIVQGRKGSTPRRRE